MYRYKRLLVAMNLSNVDADVVRFAGMISRMAKSERVYFSHVAKTLEIPAGIRKEYPELAHTPTDVASKQVGESVGEHFNGYSESETRIEVMEGSPITELLRLVRKHDIDLVLVGKDPDERAFGALSEKLARKAPCSVLVVPPDAPPEIRRIVLASDFSEQSADAMGVALAFAGASQKAGIVCLHSYMVPLGYHKLGETYEDFAEVMHENARTRYDAFKKGFDFGGVNVDVVFELSDQPAAMIQQAAIQYDADLVVVGARGRSAAAAVLLGSTAEQLIHDTERPLLAVKKKGTGLGLLDALFEL